MAEYRSYREMVATLKTCCGELIASGEIDLLVEPARGEVELVGEEWTIHVEGWPARPLSWIALDEEPDNPTDFRSTLSAALNDRTVKAIAAMDFLLGGELSAALLSSGDPLSRELAAMLAVTSRESDQANV